MSDIHSKDVDWTLTTWEGARREQLRRWAALLFESIVEALEEMQELAAWLHPGGAEADAPQDSRDERPTV